MNDGAARIGLGTVQFGLDYGVTNAAGKVPEREAGAILQLAARSGIRSLDTAYLYGDSETVLGRHLAGGDAFRIVTKTDKFGAAVSGADAGRMLRAAFEASLARLQQPRVYALLIHDADDLLGPYGAALWREMEALKQEGLTQRIGVSVYDGSQIDAALADYPIELVQLPYNPLDRRLVEGGQLDRLAAKGVEVHARSLFLQGVLLQDPGRLPPPLEPLAAALGEMHRTFADQGLSRLEGILASAFECGGISTFLCGVASADELQDIVLAADKAHTLRCSIKFASSHPLDPRLLNPARWSELN